VNFKIFTIIHYPKKREQKTAQDLIIPNNTYFESRFFEAVRFLMIIFEEINKSLFPGLKK
jgi:hypothetical protein